MAGDSALKVKELCDHITGFLQESDLRACSVVSSIFTSSAQRHPVFREIMVNRGAHDIDDISMLGRHGEVATATPLCAVLEGSPHLIPFIRRMRLSLEANVLRPLSQLEFPNLYDVVFHHADEDAANEETISLAARLIGAQAITRVGLIVPVFKNMYDMGRLLERHTPALKSFYLYKPILRETVAEGERPASIAPRPQIETLECPWAYHADPVYLLDPMFPLDLSALTVLTWDTHLSPPSQACGKDRTHTYSPDCRCAYVYLAHTNVSNPRLFLARLPALRHLTITWATHQPADVEALLAGLPPQHPLHSLDLQIRTLHKLSEQQLRPVAAARASLHDACDVTVSVRRFLGSVDGIDDGPLLRTLFAELDQSGRLHVVV
ncbi:hypothetical protein DFH06DRAFT_1338525 [Mycena polygramma]|nr:hypothetical protein DFH06DRAFT_1338525 [Mycena polygramma]